MKSSISQIDEIIHKNNSNVSNKEFEIFLSEVNFDVMKERTYKGQVRQEVFQTFKIQELTCTRDKNNISLKRSLELKYCGKNKETIKINKIKHLKSLGYANS